MFRRGINAAVFLLLLTGPVLAEDMPPIDRDLWTAMQQAFAKISMPLEAHQMVQQIMQNVEQQAAQRKAAAEKPK